jgi:hypothetical protein
MGYNLGPPLHHFELQRYYNLRLWFLLKHLSLNLWNFSTCLIGSNSLAVL